MLIKLNLRIILSLKINLFYSRGLNRKLLVENEVYYFFHLSHGVKILLGRPYIKINAKILRAQYFPFFQKPTKLSNDFNLCGYIGSLFGPPAGTIELYV